jgi:hypothetical protein
VFRPDATPRVVGYNLSTGYAYSAVLSTPGTAQPVGAGSATITDISADGVWGLFSVDIGTLWLTRLADPATAVLLSGTNPCAGTFGPHGSDLFVECTQAPPTYLSPTFYHAAVGNPTLLTQLSPALADPSPPTPAVVTPDGGAILYTASHTDSGGTYFAVFMVKVSAPGQEIQLSQRVVLPNQWVGGPFRFSPDGTKMVYPVLLGGDPSGCNLWMADLVNPTAPVMVNGPHGNAACPFEAAFSPDSKHLVYAAQAPGSAFEVGLYEVALNNPGVAVTLLPPTLSGYSQPTYDESGNDVFYTASGLFEFQRGASGPSVQLSPPGQQVVSYARSADGTLIVYNTAQSPNLQSHVYVMNRSVPGRSTLLSSPASQLRTDQVHLVTE